eukprot:307335-Pelagomonas_calceolata.AAC.4
MQGHLLEQANSLEMDSLRTSLLILDMVATYARGRRRGERDNFGSGVWSAKKAPALTFDNSVLLYTPAAHANSLMRARKAHIQQQILQLTPFSSGRDK